MTESQQQLVSDNLKLVYHIAWKLSNTEFVRRNREDLMSEGMVGLVKAARAFDPTKGVKFASFASRCINNEMLMFIRRNKKFEADLSLFSVIGSDDEGREMLLMDILSDSETNIEKAERASNAADDLRELTTQLDEREKRIVGFIGSEMTQKQMSAELEISQSYVSRIIRKIRAKYKGMTKRCGGCG